MKFFFVLVAFFTQHLSADVEKIFNVAPFAIQQSGEIVYSQNGNFIIEGNVLTKKERTFKCDFKLGQNSNEIMNVHRLDQEKMILVKETHNVNGWQKEAYEINLVAGTCESVNVNLIGDKTYKPSFGFKRRVSLPSLNLEVKVPFMYNQGGLECYGVKIVDLQTQKESEMKWDKFCGEYYGVNLITIQNDSNVALLHNTREKQYDFYIGVDNLNSNQIFKFIDSIHTSSSSLTFVNIKNNSNSILLFTVGGLGQYPVNKNQGVYILKLQ